MKALSPESPLDVGYRSVARVCVCVDFIWVLYGMYARLYMGYGCPWGTWWGSGLGGYGCLGALRM